MKMTAKQYDELSAEERRDILSAEVCPFCGGKIVTYGTGILEGWETTCNKCDFLFGED